MVKDIAMLITVGTGIGGTEEATNSLAHGILHAINQFNPKKVIFFGSDLSIPTIDSLKKQYLKKENDEFDFYEFVKIKEIDNFRDCFTLMKDKLLELNDNYKIIIDYTSGTKTMTMSAAFVSMLYHKKLVLVKGKRMNGIVQKGTEEISSQNLYLVYDELMMSKVKEMFNTNRFESGKTLLEDIIGMNDDKLIFEKLFNAYSAFDSVNYELAFENFNSKEFSEKWPELTSDFQKNAKALNILNTKKHNLKCYYILASLLNNARRRAEEHKYDDAIARLYRSLELIGQIKLKEYGINTSNVNLDKLKENNLSDEFLKSFQSDEDNKIKIGLTQDYILLNELKDELGLFYMEKHELILEYLKYRNNSILAHGLNSQNEKHYNDFRDIILKASEILNKNINEFILETKFPKFNL